MCLPSVGFPFASNQLPEIAGGSVPAVNAGGASSDPEVPRGAEAPNAGERLVDGMLHDAHLTGPHELAGLISRHAATLGVQDALAYLVDLQQTVLIPLLEPDGPGPDRQLEPLVIDSTVAGRSYQHVEVLSQRVAQRSPGLAAAVGWGGTARCDRRDRR